MLAPSGDEEGTEQLETPLADKEPLRHQAPGIAVELREPTLIAAWGIHAYPRGCGMTDNAVDVRGCERHGSGFEGGR